jgi:LPS sulfotransferase NodH
VRADIDERVKHAYVICSTPRAGTHLLGSLLTSSGCAGRPEEPFTPNRLAARLVESGSRNFGEYLLYVVDEGTTPNGWFGFEIMGGQIDAFAELLLADGLRDRHDTEPCRELFSDVRFIWLTRENRVAQAVSFAKAVQSGAFLPSAPISSRRLRFDPVQIRDLIGRVSEHNARWDRYFAEWRIRPITVTYEGLTNDRSQVLARVMTQLGLDPPTHDVEPRTTRLADEENVRWIRRYRELALDKGWLTE